VEQFVIAQILEYLVRLVDLLLLVGFIVLEPDMIEPEIVGVNGRKSHRVLVGKRRTGNKSARDRAFCDEGPMRFMREEAYSSRWSGDRFARRRDGVAERANP